MHSAPSVSFPVGRCRFAGALLIAVWVSGCLAVVLWTLQAQVAGWRQGVAAAGVLVTGVVASIAWLRSPTGELIWQEGWSWRARDADGSGRVSVVLDLQAWVLVQWTSEAGQRLWLWLDGKSDPAHWNSMRRALYSRAKIEASPGLRPSAATS